MEIDEHWLHSTRSQIIHIIKDLSDSRSHLCHAVPKIKNIGTSTTELALAIEQNIDALRLGTDETIAMCADLADVLKRRMKDPHAKPNPSTATTGRFLTPYQRRLIKEGALNIVNYPLELTKTEQRMPRIAPFTLRKKKLKPRHSNNKTNIPL